MNHKIGTTLLATTVTGALLGLGAVGAQGAADPLCHGEPATFVGTDDRDVLDNSTTSLGRNPVIVLGGGNDEIRLGDGIRNLVVCGEGGDDQVDVYADAKTSLIDGGPGDDYIGNADDVDFSLIDSMTLIGGSGSDHLRGGNAEDRLVGGSGNDRAFGLGSDDRLVGGSGDDGLFGLGSDDVLLGGEGNDILDGDSPYFGKGRDLADGGPDSDRCQAEIERECER